MTKSAPSPPYPTIDLGAAVERIRAFARSAPDGAASEEAAIAAIGYGSRHGTSVGVLNALRQFQLLEAQGDGYRLSPLAGRVIEEGNEDARRRALAEAARKPRVFDALVNRFGASGEFDDEEAREFLADAGFQTTAALRVTRAFRRTLQELATSDAAPGPVPGCDGSESRGAGVEDASPADLNDAPYASRRSIDVLLKYRLRTQGEVVIGTRGDARIEDVLVAVEWWLEMKKAESAPSPDPRPGTSARLSR